MDPKDEPAIQLADSITHVPDSSSIARVIICGSHGGWASAVFALKKRLKGILFNDAGGGKDQAGIAGLLLLEKHGICAATVDAFTARIGIARETEAGIISHVNALSQEAGICPGITARQAAELIRKAPLRQPPETGQKPGEIEEQMTLVHTSPRGIRIVTMDSNSMVTPENRNDIILTGSHGGLVGDAPAVKYPVIAAFYNDAGVGKENAGIARLPWLQNAGIIAATVGAQTARIGIGLETYRHGIISHANALAVQMGISPGMRAKEAAWRILREKEKQPRSP
ncbi:MAG: hypothetical protein OEW45_15605 [Deltaproteobacteria bacterium]|nr:hypothetical protein [Deltaproteobacteria bacterium]